MSKVFKMRILIDADLYPDLYAKLNDAKHPRARAAMLRNMAVQFLGQQSGRHHQTEISNAAHGQVVAAATEQTQPNSTNKADSYAISTSTTAKPEGLRLSTNQSSVLVKGVGKYLS